MWLSDSAKMAKIWLENISIYIYTDPVKINKKFVAIGIDKRGNMDYIYTVRVYTDLDQ